MAGARLTLSLEKSVQLGWNGYAEVEHSVGSFCYRCWDNGGITVF